LFALATVPLDFAYDLVIGLAVVLGVVLREAVGEPQPDPTTEAFAEVGLETWPPVRTRLLTPEPSARLVAERRSIGRADIAVAAAPPA